MYHKADKGHLFLYTVRGGALVLHEVGFCSHKGSGMLWFCEAVLFVSELLGEDLAVL